jgi:hypothetical protein
MRKLRLREGKRWVHLLTTYSLWSRAFLEMAELEVGVGSVKM